MADAPFAAVCSWRAILFISHIIFPTDNEKPVFDQCPGDQDVTTDIGYPTAVVNWTQPTATDNSGIQTLTSTHKSGENFTIGNNTVTYTATDDAGNTETCTFFVIVSGKCLLLLYPLWNSFLSFSESWNQISEMLHFDAGCPSVRSSVCPVLMIRYSQETINGFQPNLGHFRILHS